MKKTALVLTALMLTLAMLVGCAQSEPLAPTGSDSEATAQPQSQEEGQSEEEQPVDVAPIAINVGGLTGPTTMGMVKLIEDDEQGVALNDYTFTVAGSADEITPKLIGGELDFATIPSNLASVLYNNTEGEIVVLASSAMSVLYVVEQGEAVQSVQDLVGKTIYATGKGSTPEYVLRHVLTQNGIDPDTDLTIEWKSEPAEAVALMQQDTTAIAMLPQPFVTAAGSQLPNLRVALDMGQLWDDLGTDSQVVTGVLVGRRSFIEENPENTAVFLQEYKNSLEYANTNVTQTAALVEKVGIVGAAVAEKALPECNITYLDGQELRLALEGYLKVLYEQNESSIGGALPGDDFYHMV